MEYQSYEHGMPSWVDLGAPDPDAAAAFYAAVFGWEVVGDPSPDAGGYRMCLLRGKPVAGIGPAQNPGPPFWTTYVTVTSADDAAARITAAGGATYAPPFDVMTFGRMGVFADPAGAVFSVWEARDHKGAAIVNEPGSFCWNELVTTDPAGAAAFYGAVFGWTTAPVEGAEHGYTELKLGNRPIAGMMEKPDSVPAEVPPYWGVYFAVEDTDATVAKVQELGGSLLVPPVDIPSGRFAIVADPQGAVFGLMRM